MPSHAPPADYAIQVALARVQAAARIENAALLEDEAPEDGETACPLVTAPLPLLLLIGVEVPNEPEDTTTPISDGDTQILPLPPQVDETQLAVLIEAGIAGYLAADEGPSATMTAVHNLAQGGATRFSRQIAAALLREKQADQKPTAPVDLTSQEYRVLRLLAKGYTNKAIAKKLFRSRSTVKKHLSSIYEKMALRELEEAKDLSPRMKAVAEAHRRGLL